MNYDELSGLPYPKDIAGEITLDLTGCNLCDLPDYIHVPKSHVPNPCGESTYFVTTRDR